MNNSFKYNIPDFFYHIFYYYPRKEWQDIARYFFYMERPDHVTVLRNPKELDTEYGGNLYPGDLSE